MLLAKKCSILAVYAGAILGTFPINFLLSKYGAHKVSFSSKPFEQ